MGKERYQENSYTSDGNALAYKEHSEFFTRFDELRAKVVEGVGKSVLVPNNIEDTIPFLKALINWTSSYIEKLDKLEDIDSRFNKCIDEFRKGKKKDCVKTIEDLFRELNKIYEYDELIPQVKEVDKKEDELNSLDDKTRAALEAWNLVYAQ